MSPTASHSGVVSLRLRRVRYLMDATNPREGVVTQHDANKQTVTVLNTEDGSFWHGPEGIVEVIA
ncbi:hypothetical protein P5W99_36055 [Paraburkholderia sp. A3BS-1L]|uniref:hypothetical protein n=1 Tax=Paraburkholderia sp. A3BS-1L TaxID=3028375 RepID=UPI003DA88E0A